MNVFIFHLVVSSMDYIWESYIFWHIAKNCPHAFQCIHFKNDSWAKSNAHSPSELYAIPDSRQSVELYVFLPGFLWVVVGTMRLFLMIFLQGTCYSYVHEEIGCGTEKNLRCLFGYFWFLSCILHISEAVQYKCKMQCNSWEATTISANWQIAFAMNWTPQKVHMIVMSYAIWRMWVQWKLWVCSANHEIKNLF